MGWSTDETFVIMLIIIEAELWVQGNSLYQFIPLGGICEICQSKAFKRAHRK